MQSLPEKEWYDGEAGTKEAFALRVGEMPNGAPYLLPVLVVNGAEPGPTFFVNATMHGDEILGAEVVRRVWKQLDTAGLRGRFVGIPMANYSGVGTRTRRNIVEMYPGPHDMNRVFPGDPKGIITERIASVIVERFVKSSDYAFDVHCASVGGEWVGYTAIPAPKDGFGEEITKKSVEMGLAFGTEIVLKGQMIGGSLVRAALEVGKVAGMVEFGVANFASKEEREFGATGITNMLKTVGMLDGEVAVREDQTIITGTHRIRTDYSGFLHHRVALGDKVSKDQVIAALWNLQGEQVAEFKAPADGKVVRVNTMAVVGTGDLVAYVGLTE